MTGLTDSGTHFRRQQDYSVMLVSQDYELFFQQSGSVGKCLFEPCDLLSDWARERDIPITFFVDAGMLCAMEREAVREPSLAKELGRVKEHLEGLAQQGHEIGLHIHPHWEDTHRVGSAWDFEGSRYQLRDFSDSEISSIVARYTDVLKELCDGEVHSYRAGGFCIEPFARIKGPLQDAGISIDSSIVPGLRINDADKGVDFTGAPDRGWWTFESSPSRPDEDGDFLEIPITPLVLPPLHYWGRAISRVLGRRPASTFGDGTSKALGRHEIIRRLTGRGRGSELSIDAQKAAQLNSGNISRQQRDIWHVMGHPKLLGRASLDALEKFIDRKDFGRFLTVTNLADAVRAQRQ